MQTPPPSPHSTRPTEFYSTYDVWTGIRTAITLALFFIFSVTIILYKSKCKPRRKYELYPSLEDMPGRPLDYYDYWYNSPARVKSLPGSVMRINWSRMSSSERDDVSQTHSHDPSSTKSSPRSLCLVVPRLALVDGFFFLVVHATDPPYPPFSFSRLKIPPGSSLRNRGTTASPAERDGLLPTHLVHPSRLWSSR
ncbi:hypothetical protein C7M84_011390 [Penaeus vannamei]|uniref:Uncharacterized protein n=1 Tax=Penaeus vannamei TaxID=6689 RepID=A0A423T1I4_PENVA|nr:hypothetical protein C7M84_011390 [Penaeus vannamei]